MCVCMYSLSSCHSYEEEKLLTETFLQFNAFFVRFFPLFLAKARADSCSNPSRQPSTVFQYELMKQHFWSTFQLQSDERETRKQLMYLQTQSSLTLFVLCSFELSAALNKAAFILTYGFLFPFRAGIVCRASRFPCVRSKCEMLLPFNRPSGLRVHFNLFSPVLLYRSHVVLNIIWPF